MVTLHLTDSYQKRFPTMQVTDRLNEDQRVENGVRGRSPGVPLKIHGILEMLSSVHVSSSHKNASGLIS